jgi:hypothetical protein
MAGLIVAVALAGCGAGANPAATGGRGPRDGSRGEHKPTCYPAIFSENSGNGPTYHVRICNALAKPRPGREWEFIVDGGSLGNRAIIFGQQVPRAQLWQLVGHGAGGERCPLPAGRTGPG